MYETERNIKHQCAEYAYRCISDIVSIQGVPTVKKEYRSEVLSTGTRIHGSGLMQTLAFYCSKIDTKKPHFRKLTLHLLKWLLQKERVSNITVDTEQWDEEKDDTLTLFAFLLQKPDEEMLLYTQKAIDITEWLKRFAEARLKEE